MLFLWLALIFVWPILLLFSKSDCNFQAVSRSNHLFGLSHAWHWAALLPWPDHKTHESPFPAKCVRKRGGWLHDFRDQELMLELQNQDLWYDPVLPKPDPLLGDCFAAFISVLSFVCDILVNRIKVLTSTTCVLFSECIVRVGWGHFSNDYCLQHFER